MLALNLLSSTPYLRCLVVLIVHILGVLKSRNITTILKNQYYIYSIISNL